jgi:hypothetical protein
VKNRERVTLFTLYPPQTQITRLTEITLNKLVITVAAHKLIWAHGKTYPKKAVAITKIKIKIPLNHTNLLNFQL